jgi:hypothetical protein
LDAGSQEVTRTIHDTALMRNIVECFPIKTGVRRQRLHVEVDQTGLDERQTGQNGSGFISISAFHCQDGFMRMGRSRTCAIDADRRVNECAHGRETEQSKIANVKITPEGVVKVLDFGLAKAIEDPGPASDPASSSTLTLGGTRMGVIMGTAAYMSPEQASGKTADRRADISPFQRGSNSRWPCRCSTGYSWATGTVPLTGWLSSGTPTPLSTWQLFQMALSVLYWILKMPCASWLA